MLSIIRPDLNKSCQWTTVLGESIVKEIYLLRGSVNYRKPTNINSFSPDGEIDDMIIEVKTQTFHTTGTAGEKILGVPIKYADVPNLYGKSLTIVCVACAEKLSREKYGILSPSSPNKIKILDFFKNEFNISYIGATEILQQCLNQMLNK